MVVVVEALAEHRYRHQHVSATVVTGRETARAKPVRDGIYREHRVIEGDRTQTESPDHYLQWRGMRKHQPQSGKHCDERCRGDEEMAVQPAQLRILGEIGH